MKNFLSLMAAIVVGLSLSFGMVEFRKWQVERANTYSKSFYKGDQIRWELVGKHAPHMMIYK